MTEPSRLPATPVDWASLPTFCCRCQIHQATNHKPICPVRLDEEVRASAQTDCDCGWCEK